MDAIQQVVADTFHQEGGRILASLISSLRDFELAEDALQDAMLVALERWPVEGVPRNPSAWITTAARNKAMGVYAMVSSGGVSRRAGLIRRSVERSHESRELL